MKTFNLRMAIYSLCLSTIILSCTKENESLLNNSDKLYSVTIVDKNGTPILMTKGTSTLPTGSSISGTGYYADMDLCTLSYSPASGYNSACSWNWHDNQKPEHSSGSSSNNITRDYRVTVTETKKQEPKATITLQTRKGGSYGPAITMRATGGGEKVIGSTCLVSTTAQNYIDPSGRVNTPTFDGWFIGNKIVYDKINYSFTVTGNVTYVAQWSWI